MTQPPASIVRVEDVKHPCYDYTDLLGVIYLDVCRILNLAVKKCSVTMWTEFFWLGVR